jgi:RNA-directed DNA polymerase
MQTSDEKVTVSQAHTSPCDWNSIDWKQANEYVRKLRQAIFRATRDGDLKRVRTLQRIMLRSYENRVVSVRRVTQTNAGKHTPGVDKIILKTPEARGKLVDLLANYEPWKPLPARRVYIPKANGSDRPLGIPVITDRAIQAIEKNALEPYWEAKFEDSSYGFRPGRSAHDAITRIAMLGHAKGSRHWVLDADIKGCFDNIDHEKLMEVIGNFPGRELIRQWLKAGYLEDDVFHATDSGTPQGGVISPLLANIALHGMEEALGIKYRHVRTEGNWVLHPKSLALIRYADDFLVFCHTKEEAEEAKRKLEIWFKERGLAFSEEKTRIVHLEEGFDFLGFNVRLYRVKNTKTGLKLWMKPSRKAMKAHARKLKELFRKHDGHTADLLCKNANAVIRGWTNYFRVGGSSRAFHRMADYLFRLQFRWAKRQHPTKTWGWRRRRYWGQVRGDRDDNWTFHGQDLHMRKHRWTHIKRHVLVQRFACWDDPDLEQYWTDRKIMEAKNFLTGFQLQIGERQKWVCPLCRDWILNGEEWHEHHVIQRKHGGRRTLDNIELRHLYCHQAAHGKRKDGQGSW